MTDAARSPELAPDEPRDAAPGRYDRQVRVGGLGRDGQARLGAATVVVVGVGATGGAAADLLVRAGVGRVVLVDRDVPELGNLHRQVLFDEDDVRAGLPKAEAARRRLARVNSSVAVEARVKDLDASNALALLGGADLVVDGTDGFQTRHVVNDACALLGVPWVYTGVVGTAVHGFPIVWGETPCFRCYLPELPPPGAVPTCDVAGVLGPTVAVAAGFAAAEALKLLAGRREQVARGLHVVDVWTREARLLRLERDPACPACARAPDLLERAPPPAARLCGRDAVTLPPPGGQVDLPALAARLAGLGALERSNAFLLRVAPHDAPGLRLTVFADGRAIVDGTDDPARGRALYARLVGA